MAFDLIPSTFWQFPSFRSPSIWNDEEDNLITFGSQSGLSVYEDENNVYVEAAIPGVDPSDVEVTVDKGRLWIRGESKTKEEDESKKYYRRAARSFSYNVALPGDIDENNEPTAKCKNGVMTVVFPKSEKAQPKRINVSQE